MFSSTWRTSQFKLLFVIMVLVTIIGWGNVAYCWDNGLALKPEMGWSCYYAFFGEPNETNTRETANALADYELRNIGYVRCNIDDSWWVLNRDANGNIVPNATKFPNGMGDAVAGYIKSLGLLPGLYCDSGDVSCSGSGPGSWGYYDKDMTQYLVTWGYNFVKSDNCGAAPGYTLQERYELLRDAIINTGKASECVFNICCGTNPASYPCEWAQDVGNGWRVWNDIGYTGLLDAINHMAGKEIASGPGHWNDPDNLIYPGIDPNAKKQFAMWCVFAAPLVLGLDIRQLSPNVLNIIRNTEAIDIDQDPLCTQGRKINTNVYVKPLTDPCVKAVVLFNDDTVNSKNITVDWNDIGFQTGYARVRDVFEQSELGAFSNSVTLNVEPDGARLLKITGKPVLSGNWWYLTDRLGIADCPIDELFYVHELPKSDKNCNGNTITLNGTTYRRGLGVKAYSEVILTLDKKYKTFRADVGIDDEANSTASCTFEVYSNGLKVYDSNLMTVSTATKSVDVNVSDTNELGLLVQLGNVNNRLYDFADWADARLELKTADSIPTPTTPITPIPPMASSNLALTGTASASSTYSAGYEASKAIDGSNSTRWNAGGETSGNQWLEVNWPAAKTFSGTKVKELYDGRITEYKIQYYNGSNWVNVASGIRRWGDPLTTVRENRFDPVNASRVRLYVVSTGGNVSATVNEFEVYSSNLASKATATASSVWSSDYSADKAIDNNMATRWNSSNNDVNNSWLEIDFGNVTKFNKTIIREKTYQRVTSYKIQYYDGNSWSDLTTGTTIGTSKTDTFGTVSARKVRLYIVTATICPTIDEFEVYYDKNNLSASATASASSTFSSSFSAAKANDSKLSTRWNAGVNDVNNQYLVMDFNASKTFDRTIFKETPAFQRIKHYKIDYWNGSQWLTVIDSNTTGPTTEDTFSPVTGTKARVYIVTATACPTIDEFEVYNDTLNSGNIAYSAQATASTTWNHDYEAVCAKDANTSTRWNSAAGEPNNQWLQYDFGRNRTFNKTVTKEPSEYQRVTHYKIQYLNGAQWTDIVSGTTIGTSKTNTFTAVTARKMRLYIVDSNDVPTISEFEIYNQ